MREILDSKLEASDKTLPNFFCIGVKRGGTTWLYEVLKDHPEVYLCPFKKETHFFTVYYKNGIEWYKQFFPKKKEALKYKAIGEIAPTYLTNTITPKLIAKYIPKAKFILILRNPIKRLISNYKYDKIHFGFTYDFKEYIKKKPIEFYEIDDPVERGKYFKYLKHWMIYFPKKAFLISIFEEIMENKIDYLREISEFLEIDFKKFNKLNLNRKINPSDLPKFNKLYVLNFKIYDYFRAKGLYKFVNFSKKFKIFFDIIGRKEFNERIDDEIVSMLYNNYYKEDIISLEKFLDKNLDIWKRK